MSSSKQNTKTTFNNKNAPARSKNTTPSSAATLSPTPPSKPKSPYANSPPYTQDELSYITKRWGSEQQMLENHALEISHEDDRSTGREIARTYKEIDEEEARDAYPGYNEAEKACVVKKFGDERAMLEVHNLKIWKKKDREAGLQIARLYKEVAEEVGTPGFGNGDGNSTRRVVESPAFTREEVAFVERKWGGVDEMMRALLGYWREEEMGRGRVMARAYMQIEEMEQEMEQEEEAARGGK